MIKEKANMKLRLALKGKNIPYWQMAKKLGVSEQTFVRWMREPLPAKTEQKIACLIEDWK
ncbi:hypothetical protein [Desulfosporosinus sp. FKA]|uniref:hypothetical protein n=1 Tax=Desulfosporosinus sp. FKA TaxID=1969834 RepID=UPI000B4977BE|nr:hypothetical protein [Desulfosporosinus sp. FKA]